jgi:hypothetical protein
MVYVAPTMISAVPNPAIDAFTSHIAPEIAFAQVLVRKVPEGFQLTHISDREEPSLHVVTIEVLRDIAQFTATKRFRPLKSAPTLQRGWKFLARDSSELNTARRPDRHITHYRAFTAKQTGMYRMTASLNDTKVEQLARTGCDKQFCLKQRLWDVEYSRLGEDTGKSIIPCLEPCAVLLEFARTAACVEHREKHPVSLVAEEIEPCAAALERVAQSPRMELREADCAAPDNPGARSSCC